MSKHKHTPEPEPEPLWDVVGEGRISTGYVDDIIEVRAGARTDSIARMIVSCVTACAGINPAAVPELLTLALAVAEWDNSPDSGHETLNRLGLIATAALCEASK